ncbi:MAG TPA: UvrD-helicase domain-containing protein [Candidatus Omnitrophota bacterium]|nr:UvrD-helicase domain-containing protein [Candidatus Omnitrophota bacterium]HPT06723.1 UvrD-helicase domain-containing protein [Candidatus Omnitrophota bacterium]
MDSQEFIFPQIKKVEASAGSGKTFALAQRYLQLLINPTLKPEEIPLKTILAVTFTNKAAFEMKERILDFLKCIVLDTFDRPETKESVLGSLGVDEADCRLKAEKVLHEIIREYNYFQVQTIDSFINAIVSGCAFRLDLSAKFRTKKDYPQYLAYSLDRLIDRANTDKELERFFREFLLHYLIVENKTSWIPKADIFAVVSSLYASANKYAGDFVCNATEDSDILALKKQVIAATQAFVAVAPRETNKTFLKGLVDFLDSRKEYFDLDALSAAFNKEEIKLNKGGVASAHATQRWQEVRFSLQELAEAQATSAYNFYVRIYQYALADFQELSRKEDVIFLDELNKHAASLFGERGLTLPELYYRFACRFRHFLIDEFQDTSRLQWENLYTMVDNALSEKGSLFFVGDKKQAIYRFRGGTVSLIDDIRREFPRTPWIDKTLDINFRSQKTIVEFNNEVFSEDNLRRFFATRYESSKDAGEISQEDQDEIVSVFASRKQSWLSGKDAGFVKLDTIPQTLEEDSDETGRRLVLERVKDLANRFALQDIAILCRTNSEVEQVSSWMLEEGIPVESEKTLDIRQNRHIKEIISFLKFLNSPIDDCAFASFISGEIFCAASGISHETIVDFIFSVRVSHKEHTYLYREFRTAFPQAWELFIEEFFKSVGLAPLYELTVSIYAAFGCLERVPSSQGFFMKLLELIKMQEEDYASIGLFLEYFDKALADDLYVQVTDSVAVNVLTYHKAKGLEFAAVIVPFLEMPVKARQQVVVDDGDLRLLHLKNRYADFSSRLKRVVRDEYKKAFIDELNTMYVALTRASEELHIFVPEYAKGKNYAGLLFTETVCERGRIQPRKTAQRKKGIPSLLIPLSRYRDWIPLLQSEFVQEATVGVERKAVQQGIIMHALLAQVGSLHNAKLKEVIAHAGMAVSSEFSFVKDFSVYTDLLERLIISPAFRKIFFIEEGQIFQEKSVIDRFGNAKRIDRLIVTADTVMVVDFKSSRQEKTQTAQVLEYIKLVREIYSQKTIEGFLAFMDDCSLESVHA